MLGLLKNKFCFEITAGERENDFGFGFSCYGFYYKTNNFLWLNNFDVMLEYLLEFFIVVSVLKSFLKKYFYLLLSLVVNFLNDFAFIGIFSS